MKNYIDRFVIVLSSVILSFLTINRMNATIGMTGGRNNLTLLLLLFFVVAFVAIYYKRDNKHLEKRSICYVLFSMPITIYSMAEIGDLYGPITIMLVPLAIIVGKQFYKIYHTSSMPDLLLILIISPAIIGVIWVLLMSKTLDIFNLGRDYIFSIVVFTPLVFYIKSPLLKYSLLLAILYVVILSTKRTALIAVCGSAIVYIMIHLHELKRMKFKPVLLGITIFTCILLFIGSNLTSESTKEAINITFERMSNLSDSSNEEREFIYATILLKIANSSLPSIIFGHGYNAVTKDIFGHPAHNDYLEITYDYGVVAAFFYVLLLLSFLIKFFKNQNVTYLSLSDNSHILITFVTIVVLNSANCFITNATYVCVCMFCIGWTLESTELKKKQYEEIP